MTGIPFLCEHCGQRGQIGPGALPIDRDFARAGAVAAAWHEDRRFQRHASRLRGLVRCPSCGRRASGALAWPILRVLLWCSLAVAISLAASMPWWLCPAIASIAGTAFEAHRIRRADRATTRELPPPGPPPVLPEAHVVDR